MSKFLLILLGNLVFGFSQWLIVILIARFGTLIQQGEYTLVLSIVAPISMLIRMNLRSVLATDYHGEFELRAYFLNRAAMSVFLLLCIAVSTVGFGFSVASAYLFIGVVSYKIAEGLSEVIYGFFQRNDRLELIFNSLILRSCLLVFSFYIGLEIFDSVVVGAIITALFWALHFIFYDARYIGQSIWKYNEDDRAGAIRLAQKCWPLGISMTLISVIAYVPVYFLGAHHGVEAVGLFAAINYFLVMGNYFATSMVQTMAGKMSGLYHRNLRRYFSIILLWSFFAIGLGFVGSVLVKFWGDQIVLIIYGPEYKNLSGPLVFIVWSLAISIPLALLGMSLTISRSFQKMMKMNMLVMLFSIWMAWLIVPEGGIEAAAKVTLYTFIFKLIMSAAINFSVWGRSSLITLNDSR